MCFAYYFVQINMRTSNEVCACLLVNYVNFHLVSPSPTAARPPEKRSSIEKLKEDLVSFLTSSSLSQINSNLPGRQRRRDNAVKLCARGFAPDDFERVKTTPATAGKFGGALTVAMFESSGSARAPTLFSVLLSLVMG